VNSWTRIVAAGAAAVAALDVVAALTAGITPGAGLAGLFYAAAAFGAGRAAPGGPARAGAAAWLALGMADAATRWALARLLPAVPTPATVPAGNYMLAVGLAALGGAFVGSIGGLVARARRTPTRPAAP
jgi:hypothetical protein